MQRDFDKEARELHQSFPQYDVPTIKELCTEYRSKEEVKNHLETNPEVWKSSRGKGSNTSKDRTTTRGTNPKYHKGPQNQTRPKYDLSRTKPNNETKWEDLKNVVDKSKTTYNKPKVEQPTPAKIEVEEIPVAQEKPAPVATPVEVKIKIEPKPKIEQEPVIDNKTKKVEQTEAKPVETHPQKETKAVKETSLYLPKELNNLRIKISLFGTFGGEIKEQEKPTIQIQHTGSTEITLKEEPELKPTETQVTPISEPQENIQPIEQHNDEKALPEDPTMQPQMQMQYFPYGYPYPPMPYKAPYPPMPDGTAYPPMPEGMPYPYIHPYPYPLYYPYQPVSQVAEQVPVTTEK